MPKISIIIPAYNEAANIPLLYDALTKTLKKESYEIIIVDDGSTDNTTTLLKKLEKDRHIKTICFRKNFGQTAAMDAGFKAAKGDILIPMDADLQNDPRDIPRLIKKLEEGYDVVAGWRKFRKDSLAKIFFSKIASTMRKLIIREHLHDIGCTLKAYRKECLLGLDLYGEMHRYLPPLLRTKGFKVGEIVVRHHQRKYGKTKYGSKRIIKGFLDMIMIYYWMHFSARPLHFFGTLGLGTFFLGVLGGIDLLIEKFFFGASIANRPLLLLVVLLVIIGILFIIFGITAEILTRVYYKAHNQTPYTVRRR